MVLKHCVMRGSGDPSGSRGRHANMWQTDRGKEDILMENDMREGDTRIGRGIGLCHPPQGGLNLGWGY